MFIILFIQQLIASTTHVVGKALISSVVPSDLLLVRAFVAALFFLSVAFIKKSFRKIDKRDYLPLLILGILNVPLNQFLFFTSLKYTTAPNIALAYALSPAFVLVISAIFLKERAGFIKIAGIAVAFGGTTMILFEKGFDFGSDNFLGINLGIMASLSWAFYTMLGKKYVQKYGAVFTNLIAMIIGFILFIPIFFIVKSPANYAQYTSQQWLLVLYLGIFTSGIAYILWYYALKKIDAGKVSVFNNIQPVLTTVLSIIFLGQEITIPFIIGGLLTIAGVIITQRG